MEISRVGSRPSVKGPSDWFTGSVRIDPLFQARSRTCCWSRSHLRTGCQNRMAYAPPRPDFDRYCRLRLDSTPRRLGRRDSPGRCRLVCAGREALARRGGHDCDDAHCHSGSIEWEGCRLDGEGHPRAVQIVKFPSRERGSLSQRC